MKKLCLLICIMFSCFSLVACGGTNYPGNVEPKYWLSEDNSMMFYFPAEAGRFIFSAILIGADFKTFASANALFV